MDYESKIFVAGGTGLVGSAVIKALLHKGYKNIFATSHRRVVDDWQYAGDKLRFVPIDLTDQKAVADLFSREKPEYVFFAAAKVGGILANHNYRAEFIYDNLQIQNNVIHQSYLHSVKKLLFLGSSCIYPKNCSQPMKEESLLTGELEYTNEAYAVAKIAGIKMCESYNIQYGTNYISAMPTNLFGPNDNYDLESSHVLPALLRKMHLAKLLKDRNFQAIRKDFALHGIKNGSRDLRGQAVFEACLSDAEIAKILEGYWISTEAVTLWGTGSPNREFLYSEDLADACVFLMEKVDFKDLVELKNKANKSSEIKNTHINVGVGSDIAIKDLAELIKDVVDYQGEIIWDHEKPDGTFKKLLDVSRLESLGWRAEVPLNIGLKKVYSAYAGTIIK